MDLESSPTDLSAHRLSPSHPLQLTLHPSHNESDVLDYFAYRRPGFRDRKLVNYPTALSLPVHNLRTRVWKLGLKHTYAATINKLLAAFLSPKNYSLEELLFPILTTSPCSID